MDPMTLSWLIPSAIGGLSSLFSKPAPQGPQYESFNQQNGYDPAALMGFQRQLQMQQAPQAQDIYQNSPYYQSLLQGLNRSTQGGTFLPEPYVNAIRKNAQQSLGLDRDEANRQAMEEANAHNLLGSGSLAVRQGLNDRSYLNQMGQVENNITGQEFGQRAQLMNALGGVEDQRQRLQYQNAQLGSDFGLRRNSQYLSSLDMAGRFGQNQAAGNYDARRNQWEAQQGQQRGLFSNLGAAASAYYTYGPGGQRSGYGAPTGGYGGGAMPGFGSSNPQGLFGGQSASALFNRGR